MTSWPHEIADEETIVRGICSPYHVDKKRGVLKPAAYRSPNDTDEVSVMREGWIGPNGCKQRARRLEDLDNPKQQKVYTGLAVLSAQQIRNRGAKVVDTRTVFEGHADIRHGIIPSKGNPPPPAQLLILTERTKTLASLANYYADPAPEITTWTGAELRYKDQD